MNLKRSRERETKVQAVSEPGQPKHGKLLSLRQKLDGPLTRNSDMFGSRRLLICLSFSGDL